MNKTDKPTYADEQSMETLHVTLVQCQCRSRLDYEIRVFANAAICNTQYGLHCGTLATLHFATLLRSL